MSQKEAFSCLISVFLELRLSQQLLLQLQSCPTLCDPIDDSPPGSPVPGILQARTLDWVAISSSNAWKWKVKVKLLSWIRLLATPWTAAYQAPPSMGFSRQEYWSGLSLPSSQSTASASYSESINLWYFPMGLASKSSFSQFALVPTRLSSSGQQQWSSAPFEHGQCCWGCRADGALRWRRYGHRSYTKPTLGVDFGQCPARRLASLVPDQCLTSFMVFLAVLQIIQQPFHKSLFLV